MTEPIYPSLEDYRQADRIVTEYHDRGLEADDILRMSFNGYSGTDIAVRQLAENWQDESAGRPHRHTTPNLSVTGVDGTLSTSPPMTEAQAAAIRAGAYVDVVTMPTRDPITPTLRPESLDDVKGVWHDAVTRSIHAPKAVAEEIRTALGGILAGDLPDRMVEHYLGEMGSHVEIGGQRMTEAQYEAATFPLRQKLDGIDPGDAAFERNAFEVRGEPNLQPPEFTPDPDTAYASADDIWEKVPDTDPRSSVKVEDVVSYNVRPRRSWFRRRPEAKVRPLIEIRGVGGTGPAVDVTVQDVTIIGTTNRALAIKTLRTAHRRPLKSRILWPKRRTWLALAAAAYILGKGARR